MLYKYILLFTQVNIGIEYYIKSKNYVTEALLFQ